MIKLEDPTLFKTENYVNGKWIGGSAGHIEVLNPANGTLVAKTVNGSAENARDAVEAAAVIKHRTDNNLCDHLSASSGFMGTRIVYRCYNFLFQNIRRLR